MADKNHPPIIIKKKKKGNHDAHSSAWKIALADFMTALMCFFLVMWLTTIMNTDVQKDVASLFMMSGIDEDEVGIGGLMGGQTISEQGSATNLSAPFTAHPPTGARAESSAIQLGTIPPETARQSSAADRPEEEGSSIFKTYPLQVQIALQKIKKKLSLLPDALLKKGPSRRVVFDIQDESLTINFMQTGDHPLFDLGSYDLLPEAEKLLSIVGKELQNLGYPITVVGHTDSTPYKSQDYNNWDLSADRANEARRYLQRHFQSIRIRAVEGVPTLSQKSRKPLANNRRISLKMTIPKTKYHQPNTTESRKGRQSGSNAKRSPAQKWQDQIRANRRDKALRNAEQYIL